MMRFTITFLLVLITSTVIARGVYQQPQDFINEVFSNNPPDTKVIWITRKLRPHIENILGHKPNTLRIRYWARDGKSAWVLEEIGKDKPITTGVVINHGKIERIKVLIFRESRGWEIRHSFFTDQYKGLTLTENHRLNGPIDGISGATLSVRALTKLARLALYLHKHSELENDTP
jgi:hypothetical protein